MRLTCESCGTRFRIADDRVRGRFVYFRCRTCGSLLEAHLPRQPCPGRAVAPAPGTGRRDPPPLPPREWFAVLNHRAVGPLGTQEICLRIQRRELEAGDLVWRHGLSCWQPVQAVEELRAALEEAPPRAETQPPPLPPRRETGRGRLLKLLPPPPPVSTEAGAGGAAVALAESCPAPRELQRVVPLPVAAPAPAPAVRWPLWVALLGGLMMVGASVLLVLRHGESSGPVALEQPQSTPRGVSPPAPAGISIDSEDGGAPLHLAGELPTLEVRRSPSTPPGGGGQEGRPDQVRSPGNAPDAASPALQLGAGPDDLKTPLAVRIYRRNRASLEACDRLAERRGENQPPGSRVEFGLRVSSTGAVEATVRGRELSPALLSCYRTVAGQWKVPVTGRDYTTSFEHIH